MLSTDNVIESTKKCAKDFYRLGLSDEEIILSQFSAPSNTARAVEVATNSGSDTNKSKKWTLILTLDNEEKIDLEEYHIQKKTKSRPSCPKNKPKF